MYNLIMNGYDINNEEGPAVIDPHHQTRCASQLVEDDVEEIISDLSYIDERTAEEVDDVIKHILSKITTGDTLQDLERIDMFADSIA